MQKKFINILIACEESQKECIAFRDRGFRAFSCDILPCSGQHPKWHIMAEVSPFLEGLTVFSTQDGKRHHLKKWHCIIAHPPCTYLTKVSACRMMKHGQLDAARYELMLQAREFFFKCLNAKALFVAVENPRPLARAELPRPNAQVSPHLFGSKYSKATYYWLRNLPPLLYGPMIAEKPKSYVYYCKKKKRSETFEGIAASIALQWGEFILSELKKQKD